MRNNEAEEEERERQKRVGGDKAQREIERGTAPETRRETMAEGEKTCVRK